MHGARIVAEIVQNDELFSEWNNEMGAMADRIMNVRQLLVDALNKRMPERDWSFITRQIGMFSFTGLSQEQSEAMLEKHHVYMLKNGRISMAGINTKNVKYVAECIKAVGGLQ